MASIFMEGAKDPSSRARTGTVMLPHGRIETPAFMPVGTNATVKAIGPDALDEIGFRIILANTYHLFLRPGPEVIKAAGGLHGFANWKGNFLTDSGGFQVFSLAHFRKITEEGVRFRSHIDGTLRFLSPEIAVEIQTAFNSDIQMQLDVCTPYGENEKGAVNALRLTTEWARRAKERWSREQDEEGYQGKLFGIVQGNFYKDLRSRSANEILSLDLPGIAIGGLSVGEPFEVFTDMLAFTAALLPENKPRYLMGIGTPEYILEAVRNGIDLFDCVFPTRTARNGLLFTSKGPLTIKKAIYERDFGPIDPVCTCKVCRNHSRAYLRHMFRNGEILYAMLATYHNLYFLNDLVRKTRASIAGGYFPVFEREFLAEYRQENRSQNDARSGC
ncbi:MAG: tRNA guanosine(34) transglycosylase Tgt [Rectinemataceae bacterium]|nr:tRNA guanosine(34) transglycosylase Tgt [Rectinemataceae bacterium]